MVLTNEYRFSRSPRKLWMVLKHEFLASIPLLLPDTFDDCFEIDGLEEEGDKSFEAVKFDGSRFQFNVKDVDEEARCISWVITRLPPTEPCNEAIPNTNLMPAFPQPCVNNIFVRSDERSGLADLEGGSEADSESCVLCLETWFLDPSYEKSTEKAHGIIMEKLRKMIGCYGASSQVTPLMGGAILHSEEQTLESRMAHMVLDDDERGPFELLDPETNVFNEGTWDALRPGDIVKVISQNYFPADLILLNGDNIYIQTSKLDGDDKIYPRTVASEVLVDLAPALGSGDPVVTQSISTMGHFEFCPPLADMEHFHGHYVESSGADNRCTSAKERPVTEVQFLPQYSKLLVAESCIGMVVFTGAEAVYNVAGGSAGATRRAELTRRRKARTEARKAQARARRAARLAEPLVPAAFERAAGVGPWEDRFTDVLDDGNCMIHALWLGMRRLLQTREHLLLPVDKEVRVLGSATAAEFRAELVGRLAADPEYLETVKNQVGLWLSVDGTVLMALEEFFTMPVEFQSMIMEMNQQVQLMGGAAGDGQVDLAAARYIDCMRGPLQQDGAAYYNPLGEIEIEFICRLLQIRLQIIKSEALELIYQASQKFVADCQQNVLQGERGCTSKQQHNAKKQKAISSSTINDIAQQQSAGVQHSSCDAQKVPMEEMLVSIDPRTIQPVHILDRRPQPLAGEECSLVDMRIVRILNVNTNHYQVHLPAADTNHSEMRVDVVR